MVWHVTFVCVCVSPSVRMSITKIHAREILDSRGNPTVEVDLWTAKGEPWNTHEQTRVG